VLASGRGDTKAAYERGADGSNAHSRALAGSNPVRLALGNGPCYLGLVLALAALLVVFVGELAADLSRIMEMTPESAILMGLSLIDLSLAGNLMLIVIFSGYENFVSKLDAGDHEDRPVWTGTVDFSGLKLKLISSIVAISAIALLRNFMRIGDAPLDELALEWRVIVHLTFVTSGVLLAGSSVVLISQTLAGTQACFASIIE
jgi:uncharacterized protein (TIGR00645 family)